MRFRAIAPALVLAWTLAARAEPLWAQEGIFGGLQKGIETSFSSITTTTTFESGSVSRTESTSLSPVLYLNLDALVYPNVRLNAGGTWELNAQTLRTDGSGVDSTISRSRPFILLRSTNTLFAPGVGYSRREERARTPGLSDVKLINDEYSAYLGWRPTGGPESEFQYLRAHSFDGARAVRDITRDSFSLVSNYRFRELTANYRGLYLDTDDRRQGVEVSQTTHAGGLGYSGSYLRKRLSVNATYDVNYQGTNTVAPGASGEVAIPITAAAGLSGLSDTPVTARLSANPQVIDGNLTAGAGIDIGTAAPAEDPQARNIGLDFISGAEVNRLLIWVDRDLPVEVSNAFSWEIYSSPDNIVWRREALVPAAPFGPFDYRFEVDFPSVTARYIKAVVKPLSLVVPDPTRFSDIFVTEIQAFLRRPAEEIAGETARTNHLVNADARMRILDVPALMYEGFYLYNTGSTPGGRHTETLSNGLSVTQDFARVFSAYGRFAREQGTQAKGQIVANVSNATLTFEPVRTFRSSVLYNGRDEDTSLGDESRQALYFQNSAQLYAGVDLLFGFGWSATTFATGEKWRDRLLNVSGTVAPMEHVNLTFSYDESATERSGVFTGEPRSTLRRLYAAVSIDPIRSLRLAVGEEVYAVSGSETRSTLSVSANWVPFPDGALQFIFSYNEAMRALVFGTERSSMAGVRWDLSRRSYVNVSYQLLKSELPTYATESRIFSATVRVFF